MSKNTQHPIDLLGGIPRVRELTGQPYNVVWNWRERGIPYHWRPLFAEILEREGHTLPPDFLLPKLRSRPAA